MTSRISASAAGGGLLFAGLILLSSTLRAPITGVAPVLSQIQASVSLSPAMAGLLTTLPLIAFGAFAPFAGGVAQRIGFERCLRYALLLALAGIGLRSAGTVWALFLGTGMLAVGIAFGNVLMPAMVKREFPTKVPTVTGRCGIAIGLAAALASATAYPVSTIAGWQGALLSPAVLPLAALMVWLVLKAQPSAQRAAGGMPQSPTVSPWTSMLAWQVTGYMTINSIIFYALITWLPRMLTDGGQSASAAGSIHGFLQTASIVPGLLLGGMVARMKQQRGVAVALAAAQVVALGGLMTLPHLAPLWAFLFGMGSGGALLLSLMFVSMRTRSPQQAAALSGMAQCVNFLAAAPGPMLAGKLNQSASSWNAVLTLGVALGVAMAVLGAQAGRKRELESTLA